MEVGKIEQLTNYQMQKGDRVQDVRKVPDSTRRAFLAVIAAIRRDFPEDFRKLLKEAVDVVK